MKKLIKTKLKWSASTMMTLVNQLTKKLMLQTVTFTTIIILVALMDSSSLSSSKPNL